MSPLSNDDLQLVFDNLDKNRDGRLSLEELTWFLDIIGHNSNPVELESYFGKPSLDFGEFLIFYESIDQEIISYQYPHQEKAEEEKEGDSDLEKAFRVFDVNGDGYISTEELQDVLSRLGLLDERSGRDCGRMINAYDTNGDGRLDFQEFKDMMLLSIRV